MTIVGLYYFFTMKNLMQCLDDADRHVLACECGNLHWLVLVDRSHPDGLTLFCGLCNSYSGKMLPAKAADSKIIALAIQEIDEKRRVDRESKDDSDEDDWGNKVSGTKPGKQHLN